MDEALIDGIQEFWNARDKEPNSQRHVADRFPQIGGPAFLLLSSTMASLRSVHQIRRRSGRPSVMA